MEARCDSSQFESEEVLEVGEVSDTLEGAGTPNKQVSSSTGICGVSTVEAGEAGCGKREPSEEANEMTCAICLDQIELADLAVVKGCDHVYCAKCILSWAVLKDPPSCPQCKTSFNYLVTYRHLDGTFSDFPVEESVVLLKRARWFEDQCKAAAMEKRPELGEHIGSTIEEADWADYNHFYEEFDDDEEVEAYYFSAAAGRARIVLGNRRWGENGYVSSGRMQARPTTQPAARKSKGGKAKGATTPSGREPHAASGSSTPATPMPCTPAQTCPRPIPCRERAGSSTSVSIGSQHASPVLDDWEGWPGTPNYARQIHKGSVVLGSSPGSSGECTPGTSGGKQGRRARRNARRAAADARAGLLSP